MGGEDANVESVGESVAREEELRVDIRPRVASISSSLLDPVVLFLVVDSTYPFSITQEEPVVVIELGVDLDGLWERLRKGSSRGEEGELGGCEDAKRRGIFRMEVSKETSTY